MRKCGLAATALAIPAAMLPGSAVAQVSPSQLQEVVSIIEQGDVADFAAKDATIDYLPNWSTIYLPAEQAIALFEGCVANELDTADNSHGMTLLHFECAERTPPTQCVTGDLDLMIAGNFVGLNIAVSEVPTFPQQNPECRPPVPTPPPRKEAN